jgi:hypothetical protein
MSSAWFMEMRVSDLDEADGPEALERFMTSSGLSFGLLLSLPPALT